jgi:hypothetical protein
MVLNHSQTRALQALRAPGGLTALQAEERWGLGGAQPLYALLRAGLAERTGEEFTITAAGRAACPFRNELLSAGPRRRDETKENEMPQGVTNLTRRDLLDAITAAGADGITRNALVSRFLARATESCIDLHITNLVRQSPRVVFRPFRGRLVAACFLENGEGGREKGEKPPAPGAACVTDVPEAEVEKIAKEYAEMIDFELEPPGEMPDPVDRDEELIRQAGVIVDLRALVAEQQDRIAELRAAQAGQIVDGDIEILDPETVEIAIYSSGGMDIMHNDRTVTLGCTVLAKLRAFLGLFAEAA